MKRITFLLPLVALLALASLPYLTQASPREPQSCGTNYESWYFSGQQCMQCYDYDGKDKDCHQCSGDKCSGTCFGNFGTSTMEKKVELEVDGKDDSKTKTISWCRRCEKIGNHGKNCCWMDDKGKIDRSEGNGLGWNDNYVTMGYHINACLKVGDQYISATNTKLEFTNSDAIELYGSICHTIANCQSLTKYGKCLKCQDGYYQTPSMECAACTNQHWNIDESATNDFVGNPTINVDLGDKSKTNFPSSQTKKSVADNTIYAQQSIDRLYKQSKHVCHKCNGPMECTKCAPGYYMASNHKRETFDRNIAKHASFCRPCNEGCQCTEASNVCEKCEITDGTWYHDKVKNKCFPCRKKNNASDFQYCKTCAWDDDLKEPRCNACVARSDDDISNVIALEKRYTIRKIDGTSDERKSKICKPCHELMGVGQKLEVKMVLDGTSASVYKVENAIADQTATFSLKNQQFSSVLITNTLDAEFSKTTSGCRDCELKNAFSKNCKVVGGQPDCSQSADNTNNDAVSEVIHYISCKTCNNGYAPESIPSYEYKAKVEQETKFWKIEQVVSCQRCQYLFDRMDKQLSISKTKTDTAAGNESKYSAIQDNRKQLVRRCTQKSASNFFHKYEISQCGSYKIENFFTVATNQEDSKDYGAGLDFLSRKTKFGDRVNVVDVNKYFGTTDTEKKLNWFKVKLANSVEDSKDLINVCVENTNQCKVIMDITTTTTTFTGKDSNQSPLSSPRCSECFTGYVHTEANTCVKCPYLVGQTSGDSPIDKGCTKCAPVVRATDTENLSTKIKCVACQNMVECMSQGKASTVNKSEARVDKSQYDRLNYYYDAVNNKCIQCNAGCKNCYGAEKNCVDAQMFWRRVPKPNEDVDNYRDAEFEQCTVNYCKSCDTKVDQCDQCMAGYTRYIFYTGENDNQIEVHECAKCEDNCLQCESDTTSSPFNRKICTQCDNKKSYMDQGVCRDSRANCLSWQMEGGECLQCQHGYRLSKGWCYKCFDAASGFKYCPSGCDSEIGLDSNCRNKAQKDLDDAREQEKNPAPEPEPETPSRILQLLDEFDTQN